MKNIEIHHRTPILTHMQTVRRVLEDALLMERDPETIMALQDAIQIKDHLIHCMTSDDVIVSRDEVFCFKAHRKDRCPKKEGGQPGGQPEQLSPENR
jgi:hypothetical protein